MRILVLLSIFVKLVASQISFKSCTFNEICVSIQDCPTYQGYSSLPFRNWPQDVQKLAKSNLCNNEMINRTPVLSVCCPSPLNSRRCGIQTNDRIVAKGTVANVFEFPWMVLLYSRTDRFVCGGTLVSARYVLTAGHCVNSEESKIISVRVGENDINQPIDCNVDDGEPDCAPAPQDINVEQIIRHPGHSDRSKKNDIALLRLERPAVLGRSVIPICLPNGSPEQRIVNPSFLVVSGWGLTENGTSFDVLRYARVPPVSLEDCGIKLRGLDATLRLDQSQICAGGVDQIDNCAGDSGGPLQIISNQSSRYIQYGVVSYGLKSCGVQDEPGVYTNVLYYMKWIFQNVLE
ncbi:coagulation factor VII [Culex quinquefasciatus]|uniref:limulus clotting factor C n=1 Tax=Culex quinquefasciatus TaxID=7176 RepID=B0WQ20_CULQU|nr:coagulation factor VII [Culex quinquefasciatus]|eukprot:XP_001850804.1 coagulation factor VII [Culex quinquefasciatus]